MALSPRAAPALMAAMMVLGSVSWAQDNCNYSKLVISPPGLSSLSQSQITKALQDPRIQQLMKEAVAKNPISIEKELHKVLLGMDVSFRNFAKQVVKTRISLTNPVLHEIAFGPATVKCEGDRCRLRVPVQKLEVQEDFKIHCLDKPCAGQDVISISKVKFSVDSTYDAKSPAFVEYDLKLSPEKPAGEQLLVDPASAKFSFPPNTVDLSLALTNEERRAVEARYEESYRNRKRAFEARRGQAECLPAPSTPAQYLEPIAQSMDDVALYATADSFKPHVANFESFAYYTIAKAALKSDQEDELQGYLSKTLGAAAAEAMNRALAGLIPEGKNAQVMVPAITPADLLLVPDLTTSRRGRLSSTLELADSTFDARGNLALGVKSCHKKKQPGPGSEDKPGRDLLQGLKSRDYDLAMGVPIDELNNYLRKMFYDDRRNTVYLESIGQKSSFLGLNRKYKLRFNEVPKLVTEWDPAAGKHRVFLKLNITESHYRIKALRDISMPLMSSTIEGNLEIVFEPKTRQLNFKIDKAALGISSKNPLVFVSDVLTTISPFYFLKTALLDHLIVPGLNSSWNIQNLEVENFRIQELSVSEDGKTVQLAAKIAGK